MTTGLGLSSQARQSANADRAAWRIIDLGDGRVLEAARADRLESPVQPGSFMKIPALIAALTSGTISPDTRIACEGETTIDGRVIRCSHPRVRHALRPSEALALSCNVYFATLAQRLPRARLDGVLTALGLPATPSRVPMPLAATGLDGTPTSPDRVAHRAVAGGDRPGGGPSGRAHPGAWCSTGCAARPFTAHRARSR